MAGKIVIRDARDRPSSTANTANFLIPCPNGASRRVGLVWPRWGKSTTAFPVSERRPRSRFHALKGHRIPAQGANSGIPPGKTNLRSEGTPHHFRVSDLDPGTPYAVFLQNTLILWDAVPRAMPWAGMRYPFRVHYPIMFSDAVFDRYVLTAKWEKRGHRTRLQCPRAPHRTFLRASFECGSNTRSASTSISFTIPCPDGARD